MICAACGLTRDPDDLLAFWPVGRPDERAFVCRVTHPSPVSQESCFRAVVASSRIHGIGPAVEPVPLRSDSGRLLTVPA